MKKILITSLTISILVSLVYFLNTGWYCFNSFYGRECLRGEMSWVSLFSLVFLVSVMVIYFSEKIFKINGKKK